MLKKGTVAPDFHAESTHGSIHLKEYIGEKNIILFFYPEDGAEGSIKQLKEAQAGEKEFVLLDTIVFGINQGSLMSHRQFAEREKYTFPLITDPNLHLAKLYGLEMLHDYPDQVEYGVYVIDLDGVIRFAEKGAPSATQLVEIVDQVHLG